MSTTPNSQLLTVAAYVGGTLFTAGVGYLAGRQATRAQRAERRPVVATALLTEVQSLEIGLRRLAHSQEPAKSTLEPATTMFDGKQEALDLFPVASVQRLLVFYGLVREINSSRQRMRERAPADWTHANLWIKTKATVAANMIPSIKDALEDAGGQCLPEEFNTAYPLEEGITLADPAFKSTKAVEAI